MTTLGKLQARSQDREGRIAIASTVRITLSLGSWQLYLFNFTIQWRKLATLNAPSVPETNASEGRTAIASLSNITLSLWEQQLYLFNFRFNGGN